MLHVSVMLVAQGLAAMLVVAGVQRHRLAFAFKRA